MFNINDAIVHPKYGAGIVKEKRTIERDGEDKDYCCIELVDNRGMLMIPQANMSGSEMRHAMTDPEVIRDVMSHEPEALDDDYKQRQSGIEVKINSHDPTLVAQALRDLRWRELTDKLTMTDLRLKDAAFDMLWRELSLTIESAKPRLNDILDHAMQLHLDNAGLEATV
jgi:RNA polymerase-interacting CarD/CdnL/TRCF family regulator